ncbi:MAG: replicative DNA helicase [Sumerlaeia bacterium]
MAETESRPNGRRPPQEGEIHLPNAPHNLDAERAVLGAMLLDNDVISDVMQQVRAEDFYQSAHQRVFARVVELHDQGKPVELTLLTDTLRRFGELDQVGGYIYLASLEQYILATSAAVEHARMVRDKSTMRRLMAAASTVLREASEESRTVEDTIEMAEKLVFEVSQENRTSRFRPMRELMAESLQEIGYLYETKSPTSGLPTHYKDLDGMLGGFEPSALIILAARPSIGKTAFALNIAQNVATFSKVPVAIFSLEMGADQLNMRILCGAAGVSGSKVRKGKIREDEWDTLRHTASDMMNLQIHIDDSADLSIVQLRSRARRLKSKFPDLGLIIVDYLQLMSGGPSGRRQESRQQEVSDISRGMKQLAKELSVPVLALSQLSRNIESRSGKEKSAKPMLSDLRESGAIEQDADVVMFVHRERVELQKDEDGQQRDRSLPIPTEIIVGKNRNGPIGSADLMFLPDFMRFTNALREG